MIKQDTIKRFFEKVSVRSETDCWIWTGSKDHSGYGVFKSEFGVRAHRLSYFIKYGSFDKNFDVLHKCDNPSCVNPSHLFLGTHSENMKDMIAKGRSKRGENSGKHKLSTQQAREIKERIRSGEKDCLIAKDYNVSSGAIRNIRIGRCWFWL